MSPVTFAELIEAVRGNLGNRTDKDAEIRRAINFALRRAVRDHDWRSLDTRAERTTTVGEEFINLPDRLRVLWAVRVDDRLIPELHPLEHERLRRPETVRHFGRPFAYSQMSASVEGTRSSARSIRLYPVPDTAYRVELLYSRWPAELVNDTDTPEVPGIEAVIVAGATAELYMHLQQYEDAAAWLTRYRDELQAARLDDKERVGWIPGRVGRHLRWWSWSTDPALDPWVKRVR